MIPWPWNRTKASAAVALPKPAELPKLRTGQKRCRYCHHGIVRMSGELAFPWWTPMGEPPAPGVTLPNECPGQLLEAGTRRFGGHQPA